MNFVFKLSENLRDEVIEHYKKTSSKVAPQYTIFQSKDAGTVVTLYESGKIMFQGIGADVDYNLWRDREAFLNKRDIDLEINKKKIETMLKEEAVKNSKYRQYDTIGSDEVGTGDYFGPIVVTASYVNLKDVPFLNGLGVKDSKKLTDKTIMEIAPKIIKRIPHVSYIMSPKEYNDYPIKNLNQIKSVLHNKVLFTLISKNDFYFKYIVIDEFTPYYNYYRHLSGVKNIVKGIDFVTKAEDQCYSVGVSSVISRYLFLLEMKKLSEKYGMEILKGASNKVDELGKNIVEKFGYEELENVAKLNYKNTEKISEMLNL